MCLHEEIMSASSSRNVIRWGVLGFILLLGAGLIGFVRTTSRVEYAFRNPLTFVVIVFTSALLALWFLFLSGVRWRTRLITLAAAISIVVGFGAATRVDGFY